MKNCEEYVLNELIDYKNIAYDRLKEINDLQERIDKAIYFCNDNYDELTDYGYDKEIVDKLLNILKGNE